MILRPEFPDWSAPLWLPMRNKIMHGGRASSKSWTVARVLLVKGVSGPLHWLCAREVQRSIKDSVHKLIRSQIELLNIGAHYEVFDHEIRGVGRNTLFSFVGLGEQTKDSIRSYDGYDGVWVEEGQGVSDPSWEVLDPTIRKPGSEVWVTMNPDMATDPTYRRYVLNPPPNSWVKQVNWRDNPWFSAESEASRVETLRLDKVNGTDRYPNVWDGVALLASVGAIYEREMVTMQARGGVCSIPYDPMLPVHWVFDLGWGDCTSVGGFQRHAGEVRLIEYIEASRRPLDWYAEQIGAKGWRVGSIILPKDSEQANMASGGRSTKDNAEAIWGAKSVKLLKSQNLEEGIRMVRGMFPRLYMRKGNGDANATTGMQRIIECASRYRRAINRITKQPEGPLHDEFSHGADMLRYAAAGEHLMQNSMETIETVEVIQSPTNWMAR